MPHLQSDHSPSATPTPVDVILQLIDAALSDEPPQEDPAHPGRAPAPGTPG